MTEKGIVTANLLNNLLINIDKLSIGEDAYLSIEEFALGLPEISREFDVCWGYANVEASTASLAQHEITIGKGISRNSTGSLNEVTYDYTSLDLTSLLASGQTFENIYAFGSIFITPDATVGNPPNIEAVILKGTSSGSPLLMVNDLDLNTVLYMIKSEEVLSAEKPESNSIEIYKFLLDIKYYNSSNPELKDVKIYLHDKRLPRGWGGYADENLFTSLTSYIIFKNEDYGSYLSKVQEDVYNIVKSWINLRSWSPNFIDYWTTNSSDLPDRLKEYLETEFSLIF